MRKKISDYPKQFQITQNKFSNLPEKGNKNPNITLKSPVQGSAANPISSVSGTTYSIVLSFKKI